MDSWCQYHSGSCTDYGQNLEPITCIPLLFGASNTHPLIALQLYSEAFAVSYYIGWLCVGINSSILSMFSVAFLSQWWLRTRYPRWFNKYNYVVAAALDGGTQVRIHNLSHADNFFLLNRA